MDGEEQRTYSELLDEAERLAGALSARGVGPGDRVAVLLPNVREMLAAHYAIPGLGAVIVPVNNRLAPSEVAYVLGHAGASCFIHDGAGNARGAVAEMDRPPTELIAGPDGDYDSVVGAASPHPLSVPDERSILSINYTSGTTGRPKGVMYTHRGAFLHTMGVIAQCEVTASTRYLWTLPMFHCHGWAFVWAVTAMGGRHVCLDRVDPEEAWKRLREQAATHLCGAPTVLDILLGADLAADDVPLRVFTGGAPPSPTLIERCEGINWEITHLYGLTETYGPIGACVWHPEWDGLGAAERARLKARQGVESVVSMPLRVVDEGHRDVPADGETMGEIVMSGNNVTLGYYRDDEATATAFEGGSFHSGDMGVMHPDGYIEIRDRLKDVIVSGGENISSIEVEHALAAHPQIAQVAVVGVPDVRWGETVAAFVVTESAAEQVDLEGVREFGRRSLAGYKLPRQLHVVGSLPTTSTGKVQKFRLRELASASLEASS